jgi:hypothetical protein
MNARLQTVQLFAQEHRAALIAGGIAAVAFVLLLSLSHCDRDRKAVEAVQSNVGAAVATTTLDEGAAIHAVTQETHGQIGKIQDRTRRSVARVREAAASTPVGAPAAHGGGDAVERAFFDGVCGSPLYAADEACRGYGGRP